MKQKNKLQETVASPNLVVEAVIQKLKEEEVDNGNVWQLIGTPDVMHRPWNTLYFIVLKNGQDICRLVVKIGCYPDQKYPEFSWQAEDLIRRGILEYNSLEQIADYFSRSSNPRLKYIKPYSYIRQINAIVMEHVDGRPLHHTFYKPIRLLFSGFREKACHAMAEAGEWLYTLHQMPVNYQDDIAVRGPADNCSNLSTRIDQLVERGIDIRGLTACYRQVVKQAMETGCSRRVWRHGDYRMGNVLVLKDGGVLGFDTPLDTVDSPYCDLAMFNAMLKTSRKSILTLGLLPGTLTVRKLSAAFLDGYFKEKSCDRIQLAVYEGTFLLQRWQEDLDDIDRYSRGKMMVPIKAIAKLMVNITFRKLVVKWIAEVLAIGLFPEPPLSARKSASNSRQAE